MATSTILTKPDEMNDIGVGPDNPQAQNLEEQQSDLDVPSEYVDLMVKTVTAYRTQWAPDMLIKKQGWMKNVLMYRGQQMLAFDPGSNTYFDAWQWWQKEGAAQNKMDGQNTDLDQFLNNITKQLGQSFIGTMSRANPPILIQPQNAEDLSDAVTSTAAQEAITIIESANKVGQKVRQGNFNLYNFGAYFRYTRGVRDGENGWDEEEILGQVPVQKPDRMHCQYCGTDTPMAKFQGNCQGEDCGRSMGPSNFYPAEDSTGIGVVGIQKQPKAMVKWSIYSPLEVEGMPQANKVKDSPILSLDLDIDVGTLRKTFPRYNQAIKEGMETPTTPNASWDKQRRAEVKVSNEAYSPESQSYTSTYSRTWMQPTSYWRLQDEGFAKFMSDRFPEGAMIGMVGDITVEIRPACLPDEWTHCPLHENLGLYPPSIADDIVPFNERLNDAMNIIHDWVVRCAAGITFYDKSAIDSREIQGKAFPPGELHGLQTMAAGLEKKLQDSIYQFEFRLEPKIFEYPAMLIQMAEQISGVMPQTFGGGTQKGVETAKGQAQQLDTSLTKLNIYWENVKDEYAEAAQNSIKCLQRMMKAGEMTELRDVISANGSAYRNNYIDFTKLQGKIKITSKVDEGLPQSPEQIRTAIQTLYEEAGKGNQTAQKIIDVVANQERFMAILAPPGTIIPGAAQREKTQQDINTLLQNDYVQVPQTVQTPNGPATQMVKQLPAMPEWFEDYPIARDTIRQFCQENSDIAKKNPQGWMRLKQYNDALEQADVEAAQEEAQRKLKVQMAGHPPPPQLSPQDQSMLNAVRADGAGAMQYLLNIARQPALPKDSSLMAQVSAGKELVELAAKLEKIASDKVAA